LNKLSDKIVDIINSQNQKVREKSSFSFKFRVVEEKCLGKFLFKYLSAIMNFAIEFKIKKFTFLQQSLSNFFFSKLSFQIA